jgi:hypothetical protein
MEVKATSSNSAYSITLMAAETCSNAILPLSGVYGKSPCFSEVNFLSLVGPDYPLLILPYVDGQEILECAF